MDNMLNSDGIPTAHSSLSSPNTNKIPEIMKILNTKLLQFATQEHEIHNIKPLDKLPSFYSIYEQDYKTIIYGHPSGLKYDKMDDFIPHLYWLITTDNITGSCGKCVLCMNSPINIHRSDNLNSMDIQQSPVKLRQVFIDNDEKDDDSDTDYKEKCEELRIFKKDLDQFNEEMEKILDFAKEKITKLRFENKILVETLHEVNDSLFESNPISFSKRMYEVGKDEDDSDNPDDLAIEKNGKKRPKRKRTRVKNLDPNAPKRPMNAFMVFSEMERSSIKQERKDLELSMPNSEEVAALKNLSKATAARWKSLSEEGKQKYKDIYKGQMEVFEKDMAEYKSSKQSEIVENAKLSPETIQTPVVAQSQGTTQAIKLPLDGFLLFCETERENIITKVMHSEDPEQEKTRIAKALADKWKMLPVEMKNGHTATVFGCTGFLGRYLVNNLGKSGTRIVIPFRGADDDKRHLKLMGDLGQIIPLRFDLRNEQQMIHCIKHSDVVYNLMGRNYHTKNFQMEDVHVGGARNIAKLCRENGVSKLIHVSCLNADENSSSEFYKTKALGEAAVLEEFPNATIVRPSSLYGFEDRFWNKIGFYAQWSALGIPIVNSGNQKLRPVYVGDVAKALEYMIRDDKCAGKVVELYGPNEYYYRNLVQLWLDTSKRDTRITYMPKPILKFVASILNRVMALPMISPDEIERLTINDKVSSKAMNFKDLGITPVQVEETIVRFAKFFRPLEYQRVPFDRKIKSYAIENSKV